MPLKYRVTYDEFPKYQKTTVISKLKPYILPSIVSIGLLLYLLLSPNSSKLNGFFLPGDPSVTTDALCQLSEAVGRGEPLVDALDVFCETVMAVR
jgi:hypothetical protein